MQLKITRGLLLLIFLLNVAGPGAAESPTPMVLLKDEFGQKSTVEFDGCLASLERPNNQSNYLHFRNDCPQSLEEKLGLLRAMVEMLIPDSDDRQTIRSLFIGRLVHTFPEIAQRLAKAASRSPDWDPNRAWKEPAYSNDFVLQLMTQENFFPELQESMDGFGYQVQVASVEKVLMAKPQGIPFGSWLIEQGTNPDAKLPFDAMTWFQLAPSSHNSDRNSRPLEK